MKPRRAFFVQAADPALYPPILHAAALMANAGWRVAMLTTPQSGTGLEGPMHADIDEYRLPARRSFRVSPREYGVYCLHAAMLAAQLRPDVVYASDPLGALPGLAAALSGRARLVYHEHDSPSDELALNPAIRRGRRRAARSAELVVFPNEGRGQIAREQIGFRQEALRVVWNVPCLDELPELRAKNAPLVVYYHGSIAPERLPPSIPEAVARLDGAAVLEIAGYEAPGGLGYVGRLQERWGRAEDGGLIRWVGALPRGELLERAAQADIGLALMPMATDDVNMALMVGASNKVFDYMAAGLALVVSDLPDWRAQFVQPGYAVACDPGSADSVTVALRRLAQNPAERMRMAAASRAKIECEWHYEAAFGSIIADVEGALGGGAKT